MIWPLKSLHEAGVKVFDGPHATPPKSVEGPIFLGISSLDHGRLDLDNSEHVDEEQWRKWTRRVVPQAGDVVFSYETRLGQAAIVPEGLRCCLGRRMGLLRADPEKLNRRYLLYAYLSPMFQEFLETRILSGSTVDRLPIADFPTFQIPVPPMACQDEIAEILGALDEKAEANRRADRACAQMSAALFKSWFVDFDPVHARRDRRQATGIPASTLELFPKHFDESGPEPIPKGWTSLRLAECGTWVSGGTPSKDNPLYWGGEIPWISAKSLHTSFLEVSEDSVTPLGAANGTRVVPAGAVLFLVRGMSLANEFRFGIANRELTFNQDTKAIIPHEGIDGILIALLLTHETETILGLVDDTTHGTKRLQTELVENLKLTLPPHPLREQLVEILKLLAEQQRHNQRENRTLAALRDTLLPALFSGEITLKNAEKIVGKAV